MHNRTVKVVCVRCCCWCRLLMASL